MNKNELIAAVSDAAGLSKTQAQGAVDAVFSVITNELKKGGDVRLVGFGNFTAQNKPASTVRKPGSSETIQKAAYVKPKFTAGKGLKDALN